MTATFRWDYAGIAGKASVPNERKYTRKGTVTTDMAYTLPDVALVAGVPHKFDPFGPEDLGALCIGADISQDPVNQLIWRVSAEYSTMEAGDPAQNNQENPILRPAIWKYQSVRATRAQATDRDGAVFQNTAGDPFNDPPEVVFSTARYTITKNYATFSGSTADNFANTLNNATWYGKAARTVLCEGITADEMWEGEHHFYTVTTTLHVDRNGWQPVKVQNVGYRVISTGTTFVEMGALVWLRADGGLWVSGVDPVADKIREYNLWEERDFDDLNI